MLFRSYDGALAVAREQVEFGAHVLDVCVALTERTDEAEQIATLTKKLAMGVEAPLMIDSTEADAVEAALAHYPGRAIVNSINMEAGRQRIDTVVPIVMKHGAAVVALTIDEDGMAKTAEQKLAVATKIHDIACGEYGLDPGALIFDALTFPLSTGDDDLRLDAKHTIDAIRRIKAEIPGCFTTLGVSNVSFGLKPAARHALNSVFLHECVQAGLDSAIVHAGKIVPLARMPEEHKQICLDLIYDRRSNDYDPLKKLLEVFEDVTTVATVREDRSGWTIEQLLKQRIIDGDREGLTDDLERAMSEGLAPLSIVNDVLLDGMKVVEIGRAHV